MISDWKNSFCMIRNTSYKRRFSRKKLFNIYPLNTYEYNNQTSKPNIVYTIDIFNFFLNLKMCFK